MIPSTMKTLVYEGPRVMNMREQQVPAPAEDEVLIKVEKVGICGSELSGYLGHNSLRKPPLVMGHEFAGVVAATGARAGELKIGDRVTVNPLVSCGRCRECVTGAAQLCPERGLIGAARPGAFAGYVTAPVKNVHVLPDHVTFDEGAFAEPFACAVHICSLLRLSPADRLLIVGAGPIGLFTLQAAQVYGLRNIVVVDLNRERLQIAAELGGIAVAGLQELDPGTAAPGGFSAAVDAVGMSVTRQQCVQAVKNGGKVVFSGLHEADSQLPINTAIRNELQMMGAFAYAPIDFETALRWIADGRVNMLPWTEHRPLEEGQACFERLISGPGKVAKFMLTP